MIRHGELTQTFAKAPEKPAAFKDKIPAVGKSAKTRPPKRFRTQLGEE